MAVRVGDRLRRTTILTAGYLAVLVGLGLAYVSFRPPPWLLVLLLAAMWLLHRLKVVCFALAVCIGLVLGGWRGAVYHEHLATYRAYTGQEVTVTASALDDAIYGQGTQLSFSGGSVELESQTLPGKLQLSGFGVPAVYAGDRLLITGKLYAGRGAYQGRISYGRIELLGHKPSFITVLRSKFAAGMNTALPEPLASFALGLLVGQRTTIPDSVKQDLLMVGLTHIVAVSGYNLTIILHASKRLLAKRSKRLSLGLAFTLMISFLLLTGASASIVRAATISTLSILATYYGRTFKPVNLIALAAAITAWMNPFYLWSDMGWYLSFLAFYGILAVAPLLQQRLPQAVRGNMLGAVAIESVSAEIMAQPFIVHFFGQMSLVGLPANLLVVSLIPLAMLGSFLAGLAGMLMPLLAGWVAWPTKYLLNYMLGVAHLIASLPHIFVEGIGLNLAQMIGCYAFIVLYVWFWRHKTSARKSAIITDNERT